MIVHRVAFPPGARVLPIAILAGFLAACVEADPPGGHGLPEPKEIIDLGTLVTETTPEDFWGRGFMKEAGFEESNRFEVIRSQWGPVNTSNSYFRLFNHGGPHVDAPNHVGLGAALDQFPPGAFSGPLKVFDFSELPTGRTITLDMVRRLDIDPGDVVLIYTAYSPPESDSDWPEAVAPSYEAAEFLATIPVRAFGTDAMNVESMTDKSEVEAENEIARVIPGHYAFLSRGILVYEQLVNVHTLLGKENMYFVGVPLNIKDADGMMVRPVVLVF